MSSTDRNDMFGRIPWLSNLHVCLTSELKSALNQPEEKNLGNCFSCVVSIYLKLYKYIYFNFLKILSSELVNEMILFILYFCRFKILKLYIVIIFHLFQERYMLLVNIVQMIK